MKKTQRIFSIFCSGLFLICAELIYSVAHMLVKVYGFSYFEPVLRTLTSPLSGTSHEVIEKVLNELLPPLILAILIFIIAVTLLYGKRSKQASGRKKQIYNRIGILFPFVCSTLLIAAVLYADSALSVSEYLRIRQLPSDLYERYYVTPVYNDNITSDGSTKNLIYIYMESLETTYASVEDGGRQEVNYMPNLTSLAKIGLSFSNSDKLGGWRGTTGTGWTIASLFATNAGIPFSFSLDDGNDLSQYEVFASGTVTMGDILEEANYRQMFLCGSDANFGGRKNFYQNHGNYTIYDYYTAIQDKVISEDYLVWWGFEDKILYEIAKTQLTKLASTGEPFNLTLLTADTHHLDGYVCSECQELYKNTTANVVSCADRQVAEFIAWIQEQDFYKDTVIVISGDHPRMDTNLVEGVAYEDRTIYNCFINTDKSVDSKRLTNREFTPMDMFPTVLSALGFTIEGDRLGLGTDLFSGSNTLSERLGYDDLDMQIASQSDYYLEHFQ